MRDHILLSPFTDELGTTSAFMKNHPRVLWDIIGFSACGIVSQVFIFHTLATFGSLVLVTVTVRKMASMRSCFAIGLVEYRGLAWG